MAPSRPVKILLIEDEPSIVRALPRLLHHDGYTVDTAENGQRALAQLHTQPYDLILCDVHMPVLNGRGNGDMVVQLEVETPTKLTARQKELLEEFRSTETGEECPEASGFFSRLKGMLGGE